METTTFYINESVIATKSQRFGNFVIDRILIVGLLSFSEFIDYFGFDGMFIWISNLSYLEELLFDSLIFLIYYSLMESLTQRTLGKYITGTKVAMKDGSKPGIGTILLRSLCRNIPFNVLSFLGNRSRGWHDSLSKTYVVDVKKYEEAVTLKNSFEEIGNEQLYNNNY